MRKHKLFIGIFILVLVLLIGAIWRICNPGNGTVSQISLTEQDGLRLEVKSIDYREKKVTVLITNDHDNPVFISPWRWYMDRKKDSVWYRLEDIKGWFNAPAVDSIMIDTGKTEQLIFNWSDQYGTVGSGTYRIYFNLYGGGDTYYIGVELAIDGWKELFPLFS